MPRKPDILPPVLQAAQLLSADLLEDLRRRVAERPVLEGEYMAQTMGVIDLALAVMMADRRFRRITFVDNLASYVAEQGRDMLRNIEKYGIDNPPRGLGDFGQGDPE